MRVGVDATSWANRRGFGRFARNAVGRLVELDQETEYVFFIDEQSADGATLPAGARERRVRLKASPSEAAAAGSSRPLLDLFRLSRAVRADKLDAFLFPSVYTYFPVLGTPTVVGLHDTIVESLPELTVPISARAWRCPAEALRRRPAREPALHGLPGLAEGDRGALRDPGGAADARLRGAGSRSFPRGAATGSPRASPERA